MPILSSAGGLSARAYGLFKTQTVVNGAFESIATTLVGAGGAASITIGSIPSTYKHLQVRIIARSNRAVTLDSAFIYLNADSTSGGNYSAHGLIGNGATASAYYDAGNFLAVGVVPGSSAAANIFGGFVFDLLDYANTSKYKVSRSIGGGDLNGSGQVRLNSGLWRSTAAVNSLTLTTNGGGSFIAGTQVALYGIKG